MNKNKKIKIIITFDYELSLGKDSGTALKCLIEPTNYILKLFNEFNAKGIFFIDATYITTLIDNKHKDLDLICKQINYIIDHGCDVGLHIHPQWLDSIKIDDTRWSFKTFDRYRIHSLVDDDIGKIFKRSIASIYKMINKNHKITAFRAGGWSIQPFDRIKQNFIDNGIIYDFSINPGLFSSKNSYSYYDFRSAPKKLSFWRFENDPCIIDNNGNFVEIPVSTIKVKKIDLWSNYYFYRSKEIEFNDGLSIIQKKESQNIYKKIINSINLFRNYYSSISIDGLTYKYFLKFIKKLNTENVDFYTFVCHPKKLSVSGMKNLKYLLENYRTIGMEELNNICYKH